MWRPDSFQWWLLVVIALAIVCVWPPGDDKSLAVKIVNWTVDPKDELPVLPDPLALGKGDDPDAVAEHDRQVQQYDALYLKGGWTRRRLALKVARDTFNPSTERQVLTAIGVVTAFVAWRLGGRTEFRLKDDRTDARVYYGETDAGRFLSVVVTERLDKIRVVTAYDLDAGQKRDYLARRSRGE